MSCILAAVDASPDAGGVVDRAVELAWKAKVPVWLVHVLAPGQKDEARARAVAERMLRRLELRVPQCRRGGILVSVGDVGARLLEVAALHDARTVVIGGARRGGSAHPVRATATALTGRLDRPLLVALPPDEFDGHWTTLPELRELHARVEGWLTAVLDAAHAGDRKATAHWRVLEALLRFTLDVEEARYFAPFHEDDAAEAEALLAEHDALRAMLEEIGLDVDRGAIPTEAIAGLGVALRRLVAREEGLFHAWLEARDLVRAAA